MVGQNFYSMSRNETSRRLQEADGEAENIIQELETKPRGYLRGLFASVLSVEAATAGITWPGPCK